MNSTLCFLATLFFNLGAASVSADPAAAAKAVTASVATLQTVAVPDPCCPEWLCRLLCGWVCGPSQCCPPAPAPGGQGCCGTTCAPACCSR